MASVRAIRWTPTPWLGEAPGPIEARPDGGDGNQDASRISCITIKDSLMAAIGIGLVDRASYFRHGGVPVSTAPEPERRIIYSNWLYAQ
jgi:hypothetical protein